MLLLMSLTMPHTHPTRLRSQSRPLCILQFEILSTWWIRIYALRHGLRTCDTFCTLT